MVNKDGDGGFEVGRGEKGCSGKEGEEYWKDVFEWEGCEELSIEEDEREEERGGGRRGG